MKETFPNTAETSGRSIVEETLENLDKKIKGKARAFLLLFSALMGTGCQSAEKPMVYKVGDNNRAQQEEIVEKVGDRDPEKTQENIDQIERMAANLDLATPEGARIRKELLEPNDEGASERVIQQRDNMSKNLDK